MSLETFQNQGRKESLNAENLPRHLVCLNMSFFSMVSCNNFVQQGIPRLWKKIMFQGAWWCVFSLGKFPYQHVARCCFSLTAHRNQHSFQKGFLNTWLGFGMLPLSSLAFECFSFVIFITETASASVGERVSVQIKNGTDHCKTMFWACGKTDSWDTS